MSSSPTTEHVAEVLAELTRSSGARYLRPQQVATVAGEMAHLVIESLEELVNDGRADRDLSGGYRARKTAPIADPDSDDDPAEGDVVIVEAEVHEEDVVRRDVKPENGARSMSRAQSLKFITQFEAWQKKSQEQIGEAFRKAFPFLTEEPAPSPHPIISAAVLVADYLPAYSRLELAALLMREGQAPAALAVSAAVVAEYERAARGGK